MTSGFCETCSDSLLTSLKALLRPVEATEDAAIDWRMLGFSFSRLKRGPPLFLDFLSFFTFFGANVEDSPRATGDGCLRSVVGLGERLGRSVLSDLVRAISISCSLATSSS